ncbi:T9SS type B sorting domain-containing protein, partial [Tenacibaculum sp. 190130A14a]
QANGMGTKLNPGHVINTSQTIFIYNVDPINTTCSNESSFNITINNKPIIDTLNDISLYDSYILPVITNGNYYTESNGMGTKLNPGHVINTSQTLFIYSIDSNTNCSNQSSFTITIQKFDDDIHIPPYFTPNNDGKNDTWIVKGNGISEVLIYNRFGKKIGKINPNDSGWNGYYNGEQLASNTYWYQVVYKNGKVKIGSFALVRK